MVELIRQLAIGFLISIIVLLARPHTSIYSSSTAASAAMLLVVSTMAFEIMFWEWYRPRLPRYLAIPLSMLLIFFPGVALAHEHQAEDIPSMFYQLCYDAERADKSSERMHHLMIATQPVNAIALFLWVFVRWKNSWDQTAQLVRHLERILQAIVLVLLLLAMGAMLYYLWEVRTLSLALSGSSNKEMDWSLGQILPVSGWVPVVIEVLYLLTSLGKSIKSILRLSRVATN